MVRDHQKENKIPIIVGGTGLYFNSITKGISKIPEISKKKREFVRNLQKKIGQKSFYKKLVKKDPLVKENIDPTDIQRSIRAYEVIVATKKSIYKWAGKTKSDFKNYDIRRSYLNTPKEILLKNIEKRTKQMFKNKCINEAKNFLKLNCDQSLSAHKMIGVREISNYLSGGMNLEQVKALIIIRTRQYSKRQVTWFRNNFSDWKCYSLDELNYSQISKKIITSIGKL